MWEQLVKHDRDLATNLALRRVHEEHRDAVAEFSANIDKDQGENYWQDFLQKNWWMFGAAYLRPIGERRVNIRSQLDYSMVAEDGFLDIVEIKTPKAPFWKRKGSGDLSLYRGYPVPDGELQGAITQACNYIHEAELQSGNRLFPINPASPEHRGSPGP